jgi:hypothetical protein
MRLRLTALALTTAALALPASAAATAPATQHLTDGEQLVTNLALTPWSAQGGQAAINMYDADAPTGGVTWGTPGLAAGWSNDTKCARLIDDLLSHAYSWATSTWFKAVFGGTTPDTAKWMAADFATATHLESVDTVAAVAPGDVILFDKAGTGTDHTVVVRQVTALSGGLTPETGTVQYAVQVLDSTSNPHGWLINGTTHDYKDWADTRRLDNADGSVTEFNGAGYGWMVLYANVSDGKAYGWRWGVNESDISRISDGHGVKFARVTDAV